MVFFNRSLADPYSWHYDESQIKPTSAISKLWKGFKRFGVFLFRHAIGSVWWSSWAVGELRVPLIGDLSTR
jgi:hypothetical protein